MTKRDVIRQVLDGQRPPYVPWSFGFTVEAAAKLRGHFGVQELDDVLGNHLLNLGAEIGFMTDIGDDRVRDHFGVVWDRSIDKDIGNVEGCLLPEPTLRGYAFPDPVEDRYYADIPDRIARHGDRFRVYQVGFSLY